MSPTGQQAAAMQERAVRTRTRILDATVDTLINDGYRATTTASVQAMAGVSRGALMHHFPSRQDLLLQAVGHLATKRGEWFRDRAAALDPRSDRIAAGMSLLWSTMSGPLFAAATELWVAARTDDALREALLVHERQLGEAAREVIAEVLGMPDPDATDFRRALDVALQIFRGASLTALLRDDARWERHIVAVATTTFREMLTDPDPDKDDEQ